MATNPVTETLYLLDQDVYRLGSATSPKLDKVRPVDLVTYERNGILMVRATGIGVSLGTKDYLHKLQFSGWLWKIPPSAVFPDGLFLQPDPSPNPRGTFFFAPFLICLWISIAACWGNLR